MAATERARRTWRKIGGVRLRALRERYGLSAEQAATVLSVAEPEVRARELGLQEVTDEDVWRLAAHLGVPAAEVLRVPVPSREEPSDRSLTLRRKALGAALAVRREECGLSPETAEASAGLPEGRLLGVERGERAATLSDLEALADLYACSPEALLEAGEASGAVPDSAAAPQGEDAREFMHRPESNRYVLAAMALSRLDAEALSALEDVVELLRPAE